MLFKLYIFRSSLLFHFLKSYDACVCAHCSLPEWRQLYLWPKIRTYGIARNGVYMFENMWRVLVNVIIRLWCIYWNTQAFHMPAFLHWQSHSDVELCSGTSFICENGSFPWYRCMGVACRAMWSIRWSCLTLLSSCEMGKGIQRWKNVHCRHALQWIFSVHSYRHISDNDWTVHGRIQALDCEGISWACGDYWVYIAATSRHMQDCCQVGVTACKWGAKVCILCSMSY